jgi:hypothetical protein
MTSVGKESGGVAEIAIDGLRDDQRAVERNPDRERLAETGGRMDMRVTEPVTVRMVMIMVMIMVVIMVMAGMVLVVMAVMMVAAHL